MKYQRGEFDLGISAIIVVAVLVFGLLLHLAIKEQRQWDAFSVQHHCKIVGRVAGDTAVGIAAGSNGGTAVVTTTTSSKTGYQCDDGVTYWRND